MNGKSEEVEQAATEQLLQVPGEIPGALAIAVPPLPPEPLADSEEIEERKLPPPPVHPLAALVTIALDTVFAAPEVVATMGGCLVLAIAPVVFLVGLVATVLIQRTMGRDSWGPSIAKGLAMGVFAGVPYQVTSYAVGGPLLAWAGLHHFSGGEMGKQVSNLVGILRPKKRSRGARRRASGGSL